jgi:hypothetical protein
VSDHRVEVVLHHPLGKSEQRFMGRMRINVSDCSAPYATE